MGKAPTKRKNTQNFYGLAVKALQSGNRTHAMEYAFQAFEQAPKDRDVLYLLSHILKSASFQNYNPKIQKIIQRLIVTRGIDHQNLSKAWLSLLLADPSLSEFQKLHRNKEFDTERLQKELNTPFLLAGLEAFLVFDYGFENTLRHLHSEITAGNIHARNFTKALATYNAHTEGLIYQDDIKPIKIDNSIEILSTPDNTVHREVREMYEQNPYPRWLSCDTPPADTTKTHKHLIAGCGTGYGTAMTALMYPNAQITAIDLSLASLTYAKTKARQCGVKNVTFKQADILKLDGLESGFDIIECSGVLHHMDAPLEGWKALIDKLAPNGRMHIGLYSKPARADIYSAREIIEQQGFKADYAGITAARKNISALPEKHPVKAVLTRRDFYSISSCRDLLFHCQEFCYTTGEIADMLEELGLTFEGFDIPNAQIVKAYKQQFPDDPMMKDLSNWGAFETQNPDTFKGMYQFWCKPTNT